MQNITSFFLEIKAQLGPGFFVVLGVMFFIGAVAQWRLYQKSGQPGIAALIPGWNVVAFMKIIGRPASHALYLLIPGFNLYFIVKMFIELNQSFGRNHIIDHVLIFLLNGLYILNLGLSYEARYEGPAYPSGSALRKATAMPHRMAA